MGRLTNLQAAAKRFASRFELFATRSGLDLAVYPAMEEHGEPSCVLLVEDDQPSREALARILAVEGYCVDTAENGAQAFERLHHPPRPFVVLLDLGLPVVSGQDFISRQKQEPEIADIPVVVITAAFEPWVPDAVAVLPKPLDLPALKHLLSVLRARQSSRCIPAA